MSVEACAELVQRADPDRFLATMAAPRHVRADFFALFAFNVEVSRAPWVTKEPLIAQMRLQWWLDVLDEIENDQVVRAHEVTAPLAQTVKARKLNISRLRQIIEARHQDIDWQPFPDISHLWSYLVPATGGLMISAAECLGHEEQAEEPALAGIHGFARADAVARYLKAIPQIEATGRKALPEGVNVKELIEHGLNGIEIARNMGVPKQIWPALWTGWWVEDFLRRQNANRREASPMTRKVGLIRRSYLGGF